MENSKCNVCWIALSFVTIIMIISLLKNIFYYLKENKEKGKLSKADLEYNQSNDGFYEQEYPTYDNLNHFHQEVLNENCYEQMNAHLPISTIKVRQTVEHQMCYASIDHSINKQHKIHQKKKYRKSEMDGQLTRSSSVLSCVYLNTEQLSAENKLSENFTQMTS